ncbi:hypothetical protein [Luteolibacter soli]|uniref:Uncharacterized protein n=1 Tax=Luteolibacter soli TaxID=3135280 RepID=A0ABU9AU01_9BACT
MEPHLPPQPPPDAPAPPPGPEALESRRKMGCILWGGGGCAALLLLGFLSSPVILRSRKASDRTEAINNVKQVNLALIEFDHDYGSFPNASTIPAVKAATSTALSLGTSSSNDLLRQLIATGNKSEKIFWAKTAGTPRKGNDILGADALKKGECGFTYIAGLSTSSDTDTPVLMAPVIPGTQKFDPKPFKGVAVVLRIDGSAKPEYIDKNGDVMIHGMNIFDPRQPYWHGKPPDIKWPE